MSRLDSRLIKPILMPTLARLAVVALRMLPPRAEAPATSRLQPVGTPASQSAA
jgi:hypothetical protein